jgi:tRNA threonylcarbamoyladenosine biosynthesis protein TsaB
MDSSAERNRRLLLIDTCGETAGVALCLDDEVLAAEDLSRGTASAQITQAIRRLLSSQVGDQLRSLHAIGVVCGPGSFTGTRTGLAAAKGLCEATGLPMAAVSRLEVLANASGLPEGCVALDAGRGEVYARDIRTGREWLSSVGDLPGSCGDHSIVLAEAGLLSKFAGCQTVLRELHAADSLSAVQRQLRAGGSDVSLTDANYVRSESEIYGKPSGAVA